MAKQTINLGTAADTKTGDSLRTAFQKTNENFTELYNRPTFSGSYNDLTNKPTIPADVSDLTDTENLLVGGNANTGNVTFDNVTIIGAETQQVGTFLWFPVNDEGNADNKGASGVALPINEDSQQIQVGWIARFESGEVYPVQSVFEANGALNATMNSGSGFFATLPVTFESPDYVAYAPTQLILKADGTQPDYGVRIFNSIDSDTHLQPVDRKKGISLGFAYGNGSHIRVEGSWGQWYQEGTGDRVAILASDGNGTSAEWKFNKDGSVNLPNNTLSASGSDSIDIKSSNYAELWYEGILEDWQSDAARNSESYVWTAYDGTYIQHVRGPNGDDPIWNHTWAFKNDGDLQLPAGGDIVDSNGNSVLGYTKTLATVSTSTPTTITTDVVFGDPNAAGGAVNLVLPASPATGTIVTVKNINAGGNSVLVQTNGINAMETESGTVGSGVYATIATTGAFITWIFDGSTYRIIG